jgi:phosphoribosylformylglycinamidine synthase
MAPYEVMLSESQERMLAVVEAGSEERVMADLRRAGLHAAVIGRVTDSGALEVLASGEPVAALPIGLLTDVPPMPLAPSRPAWLDERHAPEASIVPPPDDLAAAFLRVLADPDIASRAPVYSTYDHMVGTDTVVAPGGDAAVLRIKGSRRGIALATDGNGRLCHLDPWMGGAIAVAEAARNVSCTGALPIAVTDCLNFGSPEDPTVAWQLGEVIDGMSEACRAFGTPVISGNVSLYNDSRGVPIWPTPVVGMLGLLEDVSRRCDIGFRGQGDVIVLLGETDDDLAASTYLVAIHRRVAGRPAIDLGREVAVQALVRSLIAEGVARAAHDCSDGGLALAIAESAFRGGIGADLAVLPGGLEAHVALFAETQSRIVVSVDAGDWPALERRAAGAGVPCSRLGVTGGDRLRLGPLDVALEDARAAWDRGLADAMRGPRPLDR